MRVSIIDIENQSDPTLLTEALDLVRATTEYTVQQPDLSHYQVHSSSPAYQVDLTMLQDGVVNARCYCAPFKKTKQCKHAVAAVLLLRDHLQHARKSRNKSKQDSSVIDEALRKMKITELRRFLSHYAGSHASFKAELLANTLYLTRKPDYTSLLMDLTPIDKYGQIKINRNNIKTLRGIISTLLKQAQQLFKEKALPETFQILEPVINHLYRLIYKFPTYQQQLSIELKNALRLFELLCLQPMAPRLQQAAIKFAIELSTREGYFFVKNTLPVLRLVEPFVLEHKVRQSLIHLIEHKIKSDSAQSLSWATLLMRWGNLWQLKLKSKDIFQKLLPFLPAIIQEMNQQKDYEDLLFTLRFLPEQMTDKTQHRIVLQLGLKSAILISADEDVVRLAGLLSSQYFEIDAWEALLKENEPEARKLIDQLDAHHPAGQNEAADQLILHGLYMLHLEDSLFERLENLQDANLMMEYDRTLLKDHTTEVIHFYAVHIRSMKEAYGGTIARQKLNNIFSHLKALDIYTSVAEKLKQMDLKKVDTQSNSRIEGFVFDLDGVIVDTAIHHFQSWKKIMEEEGVEIADEDDHHTRGASRMESLDYLLHTYGLVKTYEEKLQLATRKNEYYLKAIEQITPKDLLPGALQFLIDSRKVGLSLALGSASKNARGVLEKLGINDRFDAILDGNDAKESKPDPEIFIKASAALHLDPSKVVVFEDAAKGVQAALSAGCHCVGIGDASTLGAAEMVVTSLAVISPQQIIEQLS